MIKIIKRDGNYNLEFNSRLVKAFSTYEKAEEAMNEAVRPKRVRITPQLKAESLEYGVAYSTEELAVLFAKSPQDELWIMRMNETYSTT